MFFSKNLFTALLVVAAVSVNGFPVGLEKRGGQVFLYPDSPGEGKNMEYLGPFWEEGVCIDDFGKFQGTISAIRTGPHTRCTLFS